MNKNYFFSLLLFIPLLFPRLHAQIIYQETFSGSVLTNGCAHLPAGYSSLKVDTLTNNPDHLDAPFNDPAYAAEGWAVKKINKDTCAVVSDAVNTGDLAERWMFLPVITGITAGSKLTWQDAIYSPYSKNAALTYEVRITTDTTSPLQPALFTASSANLLTYLAVDAGVFGSQSVNLSAFAGVPVRIAFRMKSYNTTGPSWQLLIDDLMIFNTTSVINLANDGVFVEPFSSAGDSLQVLGSFNNLGSAVHGFTWHVSIGNFFHDSIVTHDTLSTNEAAFYVMHFKLPAAAPGVYALTSWTSSLRSVSQQADYYPQNDTLKTTTRILAVAANKNVLVEEFTGAWCGDCPEGGVALDTMIQQRPWVIPVSVHAGDSMTLPNGFGVATYFNAGYPSIVTDRMNMFDDWFYWGEYNLNAWGKVSDDRHMHGAPASVSVFNQHYDWTTRTLTVVVGVTFYNDAEGDFRLNCWLTEDNVFGPEGDSTDNHWNNHNYNSGNPLSAFYGDGPLLDPSEYRHDHVLDATLSDIWGDDGIIPDTVYAGNTFIHTYSYTLPVQPGMASRWKPLDISAIAFVSTFDDFPHQQSIVNAGSVKAVTGIENESSSMQLTVYPNPAGEKAQVKFLLAAQGKVAAELLTIDGKRISENEYTSLKAGENTLDLNLAGLAGGIYLLKITQPGGVSICRISHIEN